MNSWVLRRLSSLLLGCEDWMKDGSIRINQWYLKGKARFGKGGPVRRSCFFVRCGRQRQQRQNKILSSLSSLVIDIYSDRIAYKSNMSENSNSEKDVEMGPLIPKKADAAMEGPKAHVESQPEKHIHSSRKALNSCILYCFCSVSMILANKSLASR